MMELWDRKGKRQENVLLDFHIEQEKFGHMSISAAIRDKLTSAFAPVALEVRDESARHAGHAGATRDDGSHGETHFHVKLVSASFEGLSRVERQRRVYDALKEELAGPVHALSLSALTPREVAGPHATR
jgi:BolA protein